MNNDFTIDILEKDGILNYTVEIPRYDRRFYNKKVYVNNKMVAEHLRKEGHKIRRRGRGNSP